MPPSSPAPSIPTDDPIGTGFDDDDVRAALADLFLMPTPEETLRRACSAFRDLLRARRCWIHGYPLAYDHDIGIPTPDDATYLSSDPGKPPPPPSDEELGNLFNGAGEGFEPGPRLLRRVRANGSGWGVLVVEDPDPAALADPSVQDLFRLFHQAVQGLLGHIVRGERLRSSRLLIDKVAAEIPVAVFLVNRNHQIVFLNRRTVEIAGMTREDILRAGCFAPFCDQRANYGKCPGHTSLLTGEPWDGETDIRGRHYKVAVRPLRIHGAIPYAVIILADDTEAFHQRRVLAATVDRISTLLDQSTRIRHCIESFATNENPDEIISIALREAIALFRSPYTFLVRFEPDGTLVRVHGEFGDKESEVAFLSPETRKRIASRFTDVTELVYTRGQAEHHDDDIESLLAASGSQSVYLATITLNGREWGYLGSLSKETATYSLSDLEIRRDIVNLVNIAVHRADLVAGIASREKALVDAAEKARSSAKAKTMFLATMSHEIRTPLNAIIGFAEILGRTSGLPPEARECSDGITRSANALLDLLNDILDLSKIKSGADDLLQGECDLPALFREMATVFRYSALAKGIELRPDIPPDFPLLRLAGPRIRQILLNLIGNAVKFTGRGAVEWTASCTPDGPDAVLLSIDVRDTGPGIPPNRLNDIFNPFVQASSLRPDSPTQKGSGLGLLIVKRLVEACRGSITVESELGKGSVFHVRIGRVATIPRPAATAPETPQPARSAAAIGPDFLPLLVDDIALNLHILALHLRSLGIPETLQASSGDEALAKIRERRPSIVFTDLWMPGMDGAQLARAIRSDHDLRGIPVVAVTADNDAAASFDASVFDDILVKPLVSEKIAACLARLFPPA